MSADLLSAELMSPLGIVAVAIAGGIGAACRYALDTAVQSRRPRGPGKPLGPLGILLVNLLACLGIGLLAGIGLAGVDHADGSGLLGIVLASGLLGGFSTFSTVAVDTVRLIRARRWAWTALNTAGMLVLCSAACIAAWALGRQVLG